MLYFDNSATTLQKPPEVAEAVAAAIATLGNAGRSFHDAALLANRAVFAARAEVAKLVGLDDPLQVAFTSSATESLNLVIGGLVRPGDGVITTVTEHNSVLRPLALAGAAVHVIGCDDSGRLCLDALEAMMKPPVRFMVCTHGSNVTGNITDLARVYALCRAHGIVLIADVSQTLGAIPVRADMADILCFTGHKALFGPQGTGGVITHGGLRFGIVKTGGAGVGSFEPFQSDEMPDVFEAGTLNAHGLAGLQKGVAFINATGIDTIHEAEMRLTRLFCGALRELPRIRVYGDLSAESRLAVVSLNMDGLTSSELAERLWTRYRIATRSGSHCAPLLHRRFDTVSLGMVRFSFSYFNTEEEIRAGIGALAEIARETA